MKSIALDTRNGSIYTFRKIAPIKIDNAKLGLLRTPAVRVGINS
jgi:hypothetical protein